MNRNELKALHDSLTELRTSAHRAYEIALRNRQTDGDTNEAYHTLLEVNRVRDRVCAAILNSVA